MKLLKLAKYPHAVCSASLPPPPRAAFLAMFITNMVMLYAGYNKNIFNSKIFVRLLTGEDFQKAFATLKVHNNSDKQVFSCTNFSTFSVPPQTLVIPSYDSQMSIHAKVLNCVFIYFHPTNQFTRRKFFCLIMSLKNVANVAEQ